MQSTSNLILRMGPERKLFVGVFATALVLGLILEANGAPSNALIDPHVTDGTSISIEDVPYQVSLEVRRTHECGGAIISKQHVVTAAHCVANKDQHKHMTIRAGSTLQITLINFFVGVVHEIKSIRVHPNYSMFLQVYDLAVITISDEFKFTSRVQPIRVPATEDFIDYSKLATVSGWGRTSPDSWFVTHWRLLKADIPLVTREECNKAYKGQFHISEENLCAGVRQTGSPCNGDSGGPLTHQNQLIGVVSWGSKCSHNVGPSVYTNLLTPDIRDFITYVAKV